MKASDLVLVLLTGLVASPAVLACEYPALPHIPEGERIRGRLERDVKQDMIRYITEMSAYVTCVQAEHGAAAARGAAELQVSLLTARNNLAVAELEAVRDVYVDKVGPLEELFFEQPYDSGDRRADAAPQLPAVPRGPDTVLRRAERLRGGANCAPADAVCSKTFTEPGAN